MSLFNQIAFLVGSIPHFVDGIQIDRAAEALSTAAVTSQDNWWSSARRPSTDTTEDVLEIAYGSERLINSLDFEIAHFPCDVRAEYTTASSSAWTPLIFDVGTRTVGGPISPADSGVGPAYETVMDSSPQVVNVNSAVAQFSSQHFGPDAWVRTSWRTAPANILKIRLIFRRHTRGTPPVNVQGSYVPYSVAVKNFNAGHTIYTIEDIPQTKTVSTLADSTFGQSKDIFGSSVSYSVYQDSPSNVTDSYDSNVYWRSNPQPVNYAVVNFYADARDGTGASQVIDRFYIDPLTTGPNMNLYYSDADPVSSAATSSNEVLAYPTMQILGQQPTYVDYPGTQFSNFSFPVGVFSGLEFNNNYLDLDASQGWWVGMNILATADATMSGDQPLFSMGTATLSQSAAGFLWTSDSGKTFTVPFPASYSVGSRCQIILAYTPPGHPTPAGVGEAGVDPRLNHFGVPLIDPPDGWGFGQEIPSGYSLWLQVDDQPLSATTRQLTPPLSAAPTITVNAYPASSSKRTTGFGGLRILSMIVKGIPLSFAQVSEYLHYGNTYSQSVDFPSGLPQTTDGALIRINPQFHDNIQNPVGVVGGRSTEFDGVVWTPVTRGYTLRKGFLAVPPTKAKYWKFEFTNLVAETYQSYVDLHRSVRVFPADVVNNYNVFTGSGTWSPTMGSPVDLATQQNAPATLDYAQAVLALGYSRNGNTAADMLTAVDPRTQNQNRNGNTAWIWNYQPWHVGHGAPSFTEVSQHRYETVDIYHRDRLAYFVGIKQLVPYRVDYETDADTFRFYDAFLDTQNIDVSSVAGLTIGDSLLQAQSGYATVSSRTVKSTRSVRALQFATVESEGSNLLSDDFSDPVLGNNWSQYGDATATRTDDATVVITRGYIRNTNFTLEGTPYSVIEGRLYGNLQTVKSNGAGGGGFSSSTFIPSSSGRIFAAAEITTSVGLSAPLSIQIVSQHSGYVLSEATAELGHGGSVLLSTDYQPGSTSTPLLYSDIMALGTYGNIENSTYASHERLAFGADGEVYARIIQRSSTSDTFTILRMAVFDEPISWSFSVDNGLTWFNAYDVRNKTSGVLTFPVVGKSLKWRVQMYKAGASVSALAIRPWYGGLLGVDSSPVRSAGPNRSSQDDLPVIEEDPMWKQWDSPLPRSWVHPPVSLNLTKPLPTTGAALTPTVVLQ
jgi:hypothetical protein